MVRMVKGESAKSEVAKSKDLYGYCYFVFALSPSPFNVFGSLYRLNITLAIKIVRFILSWLLKGVFYSTDDNIKLIRYCWVASRFVCEVPDAIFVWLVGFCGIFMLEN